MSEDTTRLFYESQAEKYATATLPICLDALWNTFSSLLSPGAYVLDLGVRRGFRVLGIEYSVALGSIAKHYSDQEVRMADFHNCDIGDSEFDGIWAVASLLHVSRKEIPGILRKLYVALRPSGVLLTSMKKGEGNETTQDGRNFELYQPEEWERMLKTAGFEIERSEASTENRNIAGARPPRHIEWFVTIARRIL